MPRAHPRYAPFRDDGPAPRRLAREPQRENVLMSQSRLLIVHPDPAVRGLMASMLQTLGHRIDEAPNDRAALRMIEGTPPALVLAGEDPDDPEALEFLLYLRRKHPQVPVIVLFPGP